MHSKKLFTGAHVDNVVPFPVRENANIVIVKEAAKLKQCGMTRSCLFSIEEDPFDCDCFSRCDILKGVLKLFL